MKKSVLASLLMMAFTAGAVAEPVGDVSSPVVEYGTREVSFKYGRQKDGQEHERGASVGFGAGVTAFWFTEIAAAYQKQGGAGMELESFTWENRFQLNGDDKGLITIGLLTELGLPVEGGDPYAFVFGPLLQAKAGSLQLNGNLLLERNFRGELPRQTELQYQWQIQYGFEGALRPALQGFGELGKWNRWNSRSDQVHLAGPALFGEIALDDRRALSYGAAWLIGIRGAAPDNQVRFQLEYGF